MHPYLKSYITKQAEETEWQAEKLKKLWEIMTEYPFEKRFASNILYKIFGYNEEELDKFLQKLTGTFYEKFDKLSPDELKKMVFQELTGTPLEELVEKYRTLITEIPRRRATLKAIGPSEESALGKLRKNLDDIRKMQDLINEQIHEYANIAAYFKKEPLLKALKRIGGREWKYGGLKGKAKVLGGALGTLGLLGGLYSSLSHDLGKLFSSSQVFEKQSSLFEKKADNGQKFWKKWFDKIKQRYKKEKTFAKEWEELAPLQDILHYHEPSIRATKKRAADILLKIFGKDKILEWAKTLGDPVVANAATLWERNALLLKNPSIYTEEPKLDSFALKNFLRDEILKTEGIEGLDKIKNLEDVASSLAKKIEGERSTYNLIKEYLNENIREEKLNLENITKKKEEMRKILDAFKSEGFLDAIARIAKREWRREFPGKAKVLGGLGLLGYSLYGLGSSLFGNKE